MKKLSLLFIVFGLVLILYPLTDKLYSNYMQYQALMNLNSSLFSEADINEPAEPALEEGDSDIQITHIPVESSKNAAAENKNTTAGKSVKTKDKVLGMIKIEKINLALPIVYDATSLNLKKGACQVKGTTRIGDIGNTAIAAHRSHTYGRFFNRLDELNTGDKVQITTGKTIYTYVVYKKTIVAPEDTNVLKKNSKDRVLTLITCHPVHMPDKRLIIQAVMK